MPFGTYTATLRRPGKQKLPEKEVPRPGPPEPEREKIHILIVGRNQGMISEFLCSMCENLNEDLPAEGLAFFTNELFAITDVVETKKKTEQFLWDFCQDDWTYEEKSMPECVYTFTLGPSDAKNTAVDLVFHRLTPDKPADIALNEADALWLLTDGSLLFDGYESNAYTLYLKSILREFSEEKTRTKEEMPDGKELTEKGAPNGRTLAKKDVSDNADLTIETQKKGRGLLIPIQIEGLGRFGGSGGAAALPEKAEAELMRRLGVCFADVCEEPCGTEVIPVQVYGGLECAGVDEAGRPILHISEKGFYQRYVPEHCQLPLLRTMERVCERRGTVLFEGQIPAGGMKAAIRNIYARKTGSEEWAPETIKREEEA